MSTTTPKAAPVTEDRTAVAARELAQAEQQLADLRAERDGLGAKRRDAAASADSATLLTLTRRQDEIAVELTVAEVAVLAARLVHMEAQRPGVDAEVREAFAAIAPLQERFEETERELKLAQSHAGSVSQDRRLLTADILNTRRQLADSVAASGRASGRARP